MKTYVINLARSPERRRHMEDQLCDSELDFEFVDALDGRTASDAEFQENVDQDAVARYPEWLTRTRLACGLSHLKALRTFLESDDDALLVLEDDVVLPAGIAELMTELRAMIVEGEVILLYYFGDPGRRVDLDGKHARYVPSGGMLLPPLDSRELRSAGAYLLLRDTCARLAEELLPIRVSADSWASFVERGWLEQVTCLFPSPILVRNDFRSTLDYAAPDSLVGRLSQLAQDRRVFPLTQAFALRRAITRRRSTRFRIV